MYWTLALSMVWTSCNVQRTAGCRSRSGMCVSFLPLPPELPAPSNSGVHLQRNVPRFHGPHSQHKHNFLYPCILVSHYPTMLCLMWSLSADCKKQLNLLPAEFLFPHNHQVSTIWELSIWLDVLVGKNALWMAMFTNTISFFARSR